MSADVFALLDDEYARGILRATKNEPMPARQLAEELDASRSTIYDRIEQLLAVDLLAESTALNPEGHHRSVYEAQLDQILIELSEEEFTVTVDRGLHPADQFTSIWEDL